MKLCIVNEDHLPWNVPRKAIKACPGRGRGPLSHFESGMPSLFLHGTSVVCVNLFIAATTRGPHGPESASVLLVDLTVILGMLWADLESGYCYCSSTSLNLYDSSISYHYPSVLWIGGKWGSEKLSDTQEVGKWYTWELLTHIEKSQNQASDRFFFA